jgi:glycosyltransferase involved in cell wall biosynthesis
MNSEELVSLAIPLFNEEALVETLSDQVTDVIEGSGSNFEVVLVDDVSKIAPI